MNRFQWLMITTACIAACQFADSSALAQTGRRGSLQSAGSGGTSGSGCAGQQSGTGTSTQGLKQAIAQLTNDLSAAVSVGGLTSDQATKIAQDVAALLSASQQNRATALATVQADIQGLSTTTNLTGQQAQILAGDITAIIVQVTLRATQGGTYSRGR
jgi:hypothetical protein